MNRKLAVVLAVFVAVVATLIVMNLPGGPAPTPLDVGGARAATERTADARAANPGPTDTTPRADVARTRTEVATDATAALHPSVRAALTGFVGRVVDAQGRPVPESLVRMYRFAPDALFRPDVSAFLKATVNEPRVEAGEARTDDEGRFAIRGVFPRAVFLVHADADGDAPSWRVVQRSAPPGELVDLGDVVLNACGVLTGLVVDRDGKPVPGALVRAVDLPGTVLTIVPLERFDPEGALIVSEQGGMVITCPAWVPHYFERLPLAQTHTGGDGSFRLTGVAPGGNLVAVTARGHLSNVRPRVVVEPSEEKDLGKLMLPEGEVAFGKVIDEAEKPVAGAQVLVAAKSLGAPVHFASFAPPTNAAGEFELGGFPAGDVIVAARRRPGEPWVVGAAQPVTKDLVVTLPAAFTLTLEVVDAAGEPAADAELQLTPGAPDNGSLEQAMWGVTSPVDLSQRRSTTEDQKVVLSDLPKGDYTLLARSPAHATTALGVKLEKDTALRVELRPQAVFEVQVVDARSAPVAGAEVYALARGPRPRVPDAPVHVGTTGEDGRLVVDAVSASQAMLTASHPAFGNADADTALPPPAPIVLRFQDPGTIEGVVREGGAVPPPGKWMVYLFPRGRGGAAFPDMPEITAPDAEGRFRFAALRPGSFTVGVQSSLDVITSAGKVSELVANAFLRPDLPSEGVELAAGAKVDVELDTLESKRVEGPTARVTGSVLVDGRLGTGYIVQGYGQQGRLVAEVDTAGRFDLGDVKVGNVNLQLIERPSGDIFSMRGGFGSALWSKSVEVKEGQDVDLQIDVQVGRIEGVVIAPDGTPAAGAMVSAGSEGEGNNVWLRTSADADGAFAFEKAPAGKYALDASFDKGGRARVGDIEVVGGLPTRGVTIRLQATHKVSGTVDLAALGAPEGERRRGGWMSLEGVGSENLRTGGSWTQIHEDGTFEFDDVAPGSYKIRVMSNGRGMLEHDGVLVVGDHDVVGFAVRPIEPKPPEHEHAGERR